MLRNYCRISLRRLWNSRRSTVINVIGLTVGLSCGILIFLLVGYLFSFDRYHHKADRTFWIVTDIRRENTLHADATPRPLGRILREEFTAVETAVRLETLFGQIISLPGSTRKFEESRNICFTESQFFQVFDVDWKTGDKNKALDAADGVVLSERYALKYFGTTDVIGRSLRINNQHDLTVKGLIGDPPSNTRLGYDIMVSYNLVPQLQGTLDEKPDWNNTPSLCFVTMKTAQSIGHLQQALQTTSRKYLSAEQADLLHFQALPLQELSHNTQYGGTVPRPLLYVLTVIGILLVAAACMNFINMATAQSIRRSKETGIRKAIGSTRLQLIIEFLTETAMVTLAAVIISVIIVQLCLPWLNNALSVLHADMSVLWLFRPRFLSWFLALIAGVILLSGLYPALVLSRFTPIAVLQGRANGIRTRGVSLRKVLVITQFFITQFFLIAVIVMSAQVRYIRQTNLGFNKAAILTVPLAGSSSKQETLRQLLEKTPGVEQVSLAAEIPSSFRNDPVSFSYENRKAGFPVNVKIADTAYAGLFGLQLLAGTNFHNNDTLNDEAMLSLMAIKQLGLVSPQEAIGKKINIWGRDKRIVGVVADFHSQDLHHAMRPVILLNLPSEYSIAAIKTGTAATIPGIEKTWSTIYPDQVFRMNFVDDMLARFYLTENILLGLIQVFAVVAILLGCLGLYGLTLFISAARNKEISIRKVFGASVTGMVTMLTKDFISLVVIGLLIATPLAYMAMNKWLEGFAYRVNIQWWMLGLSAMIVLLISLLTVGWESIRAARKNPVKVLKAE
ncbi:ABC transporter permease [Chitinophaga pinensis]|uniref:FtsX-like permease family protein n=1 Tax=Chitinophaga pinensis (strain ATCC 43595 / DSM 2588 / LMG 13176 / NBRC 15968 / NCIMB 11800 / UQM 2034) TaxID=485918 RepID=A0A979GY24_CHIPD|nr:ABC transporter permease [Chitinophaga pinensis]ACU61580.1 protein of unknown function DUF214 [Chitinophaga pinensis DSM 2588]